jgi:hypothetical protein
MSCHPHVASEFTSTTRSPKNKNLIIIIIGFSFFNNHLINNNNKNKIFMVYGIEQEEID